LAEPLYLNWTIRCGAGRSLRARGRALLGCALLALAGGCSPSDENDETGIPVGLLLPFTGSESASASNLERAAIFAADRINDGGGINGERIRLVPRDTHSDPERGVEAARELAALGAKAVIGPESAEIAERIRPVLAKEDVLFLSPLVGAAAEPSQACDSPWFRLAGSAKSLGEALAKLANTERVERVAVLYTSAPYDRALGGAAASRFRSLGGEVALELVLDPQAQSYAEVVNAATKAGVSDLILAASPRAAAILINEFDALSRKNPRWFLSPLLKTDVLVQNVGPQTLEGALGVVPKIFYTGGGDPPQIARFEDAFSSRWQGDNPLEGAYFYYDAVALVSLALAKTAASPRTSLSDAMLDVAAPPGEGVRWYELGSSATRAAEGENLYYTGLTGPLTLKACGSRSTGITSLWTVEQGSIVDIEE
jgi:ABC-type branched-subunit amino acid transport system substrate-binding protein